MPYNEELDSRITSVISKWSTTRKKMFGGTCHLINGNMMCGVYKDYLILRLGETRANKALEQPFVKPFDITGRPMKGWVMVEETGLKGSALDKWLDQAHEFAVTLPPK
jgi:TfoX/Sxy family transcriptional regulator of competence genes